MLAPEVINSYSELILEGYQNVDDYLACIIDYLDKMDEEDFTEEHRHTLDNLLNARKAFEVGRFILPDRITI